MGDVGEIAQAVKPLLENLAKLTGPMCEELGLYFGERARAFRQRNLTAIVDQSIKRLEKAGKSPNPVPPRLLLPIVDGASVEDNLTLQEMWSGLLASASDQADNMSPSYAETLKSLTPIEARSMKVLYDYLAESGASSFGSDEDASYRLADGLGLAVGESIAPTLILETLERLGLMRREYDLYKIPSISNPSLMASYLNTISSMPLISVIGEPFTNRSNQGEAYTIFDDQSAKDQEPLPKVIYNLVFTSYGIQFMRACQGPTPTPAV